VDRSLVAQANPTVLLSSPVNNDAAVIVTQPVVITFSKPMDTASVRTAFSITPAVAGALQWANANSQLTFTPAAYLDTSVTYQVRIDTMARSAGGQSFDGNGDGVGGDAYVLHFTTKYFDVFPPVIAASYPGNLILSPVPTPLVNITFNEPLLQSGVNTSNFAVQQVGGSLQPRTLEYREENGKGGVALYLPAGVTAGTSYRVRVSRVADLLGNALPVSTVYQWDFSIAPGTYTGTTIDSANPGTTGFVMPAEGADRIGVDSLTVGTTATRGVGYYAGNPGSVGIRCAWDTTQTVATVLIPLDTASYGSHIRFRKGSTVLRAYVYGDGGKAQVCLAVADSVDAYPSGPPSHTEVSRWVTIDWVGWRALQWDLEADTAGTGTGDGQLDGFMRFKGVQFRYVPGVSKRSFQSFVDQCEVVQRGTTGVVEDPGMVPQSFALRPAYPNPFNPSTRLSFALPVERYVMLSVFDLLGREVATLVNGVQPAGVHTVAWEPGRRSGASGSYVARLIVRNASGNIEFTATQQLLLIK
jgi:hypothetical protein